MDTYHVPTGDGLGNAAVVVLLDPDDQPLAAAMARQDCAAELVVEQQRIAALDKELAGPLCGAARSCVLSERRRRLDRCARLRDATALLATA